MRHGYAAATTNRIAKVAGVSVGTLYQYFRNKNEVFDALILRERERVLAAIENAPVEPRASLLSKLRGFFHLVLITAPEGPELFRRLEHIPNALLRRRLNEVRAQVIAIVRAQLELHRHELRVPDLDLAALMVVNASEGVGINAELDVWGDRLIEELATMFVRYLTRQ
jgi:AcrR family transcriptional regulator